MRLAGRQERRHIGSCRPKKVDLSVFYSKSGIFSCFCAMDLLGNLLKPMDLFL